MCARDSEMMQQMQVNVPAGIGPGMPFEVNTPAGLMQVVCPQGATAGSPMLINVPQATCSGAPIVVAQAQYLHPSANEEPILMGTAVSQPIVAPAASSMARGPMDGRMMEAQSGCYYQKNAPCCMCFYLTFTSDRASYGIGPMFCCCVCPWLCPPGWCGTQKATAPGSSIYEGDSGKDEWDSPSTFKRTGYGNNKEPFVKC